MEVKIGVQNVSREITFETDESHQDVTAAVSAALEKGTVLTLTDDKGRRILVPAGVLGYVQIGNPEKGRVGFGTD